MSYVDVLFIFTAPTMTINDEMVTIIPVGFVIRHSLVVNSFNLFEVVVNDKHRCAYVVWFCFGFFSPNVHITERYLSAYPFLCHEPQL